MARRSTMQRLSHTPHRSTMQRLHLTQLLHRTQHRRNAQRHGLRTMAAGTRMATGTEDKLAT